MADHAAERITLSPREQELKAACGALVDGFGGAIAVGARFNRGHQRICEMTNPAHASWLSIAQVAELESCTVGLPGHPHVTRLLARRAGFALVPLASADGAGGGEGGVLVMLARIGAEFGDLQRCAGEALSDGEISPRERQAALVQLRLMEERAAHLRSMLERGEV